MYVCVCVKSAIWFVFRGFVHVLNIQIKMTEFICRNIFFLGRRMCFTSSLSLILLTAREPRIEMLLLMMVWCAFLAVRVWWECADNVYIYIYIFIYQTSHSHFMARINLITAYDGSDEKGLRADLHRKLRESPGLVSFESKWILFGVLCSAELVIGRSTGQSRVCECFCVCLLDAWLRSNFGDNRFLYVRCVQATRGSVFSLNIQPKLWNNFLFQIHFY